MKLLYFAWVREKIGRQMEERALPADVKTVGDLLKWLESQGANYAAALGRRETLRVAVNGEAVAFDHAVGDGDEIAIFPPVTGGAT